MTADPNCLSTWFPHLVAAGIPVPRTEIVRWPGDPWALQTLLDGKYPPGYDAFLADLTAAARRIGSTLVFLRTGQGSGKHRWADCCYVRRLDQLPRHVTKLVEWSHLVDFLGLPHDVWQDNQSVS